MTTESSSNVDRLYLAVRTMASDFKLKPGERINESALSKGLDASRTPLREALNRLVAEGFLTFVNGQGFFCRSFTAEEVFNLYEARVAIETAIARLAAERADKAGISAIETFLEKTGPDDGGRSADDLVTLDEIFHMRVAALADNDELTRILDNLNGRIRFVRWIDMDEKRTLTQGEHAEILAALTAGNGQNAADAMARHIAKRREDIVASVKEGYARLYVPEKHSVKS